MGREFSNDCCGCSTESYPCLGSACPNQHAEHFFCDECGEETTLYEYEGKELCVDCLVKFVPVIEGSEI